MPARGARRPRVDPVDRLHGLLRADATRLADDLDALARGSPGVEALHEIHRRLRRLRLAAGLWTGLTPRGRRAGYPATDRRLAALAREVGEVRNFDVARELAATDGPGRPRLLPPDAAALGRALGRGARDGRRALAREVRDGLGRALRDGIDAPLRAALPTAAGARLHATLDDRVAVRLARLERALARAYRRPSVRRLHRVRIALRTVRALDRLGREVGGRTGLPVPARLRRLQAELGQLHDLDILRALAAAHLAGPRRARVDAALRTARRATRARVLRALAAPPGRRALERLVAAAPGVARRREPK